MDYNPHAQRFADIHRQLVAAMAERDRLQQTWDRLTARTLDDALQEQHELLTKQLPLLNSALQMREGLAEMDADAQKISAALGSSWNPLNWFDKDQAEIRRKLEANRNNRKLLADKTTLKEREAEAVKTRLGQVEAEIQELKVFDRDALAGQLATASSKVDAVAPEHWAIRQLHQMAATQLSGPVSELHGAEQELARLERDIERASALESALSAATDGRARWEVHNQCETEFSEGSPKRVLSDRRGKIGPLRRDLEKKRALVAEIVLRTGRDVRTVVIDGNNMCYAAEGFIGLRAILPAVGALAKRFPVVVGFDSGICGQLGIREQQLKAAFGEKVVVHVTQGKADETLLNAAANETAYVISRDRYGDFGHKDAVRKRRIIGHEIVNGRVMINDLGVDEALAPAS